MKYVVIAVLIKGKIITIDLVLRLIVSSRFTFLDFSFFTGISRVSSRTDTISCLLIASTIVGTLDVAFTSLKWIFYNCANQWNYDKMIKWEIFSQKYYKINLLWQFGNLTNPSTHFWHFFPEMFDLQEQFPYLSHATPFEPAWLQSQPVKIKE